jgi:hypothetical protein
MKTIATATAASLATVLLFAAGTAAADTNVCSLAGAGPADVGGTIELGATAQATATYCGTDGADTNEVSLSSPSYQYIATGHVTASGHVVELGVFAGGSELVFAMRDLSSGWTFYSGDASRNPDQLPHAAVTDLGNGDYHIGFEDQFLGGDRDYNDIEFGVHLRFDSDDDGLFDDEDACPATEAGGLIDGDGCSIADLCPCDGWANHGGYVSCVAAAASDFRDAGLISGAERGSIVSSAAKSSCSK